MLKRTLTALLLIPPVVYLIGWSPKWLFLLAVMTGVVLAMREYFALCRAMGLKVFSGMGYVAGAGLCVAQAWRGMAGPCSIPYFVVALLLIIPISALRRSTELKDYLLAISATLFGVLYIGLTLSFLLPIRYDVEVFWPGSMLWRHASQRFTLSVGSWLLLLLFLVIWAGDICAYLVGRSMGRIPFFARVSPRKTWEGALAGLAGSLLAAWGLAHWFFKAVGVYVIILMAAWIAVAGQAGDLVESAIKRGAHQKDSGALLPGHGGFLDRIDSLLFGVPALLLALFFLGWFHR
jgi:phosphatidate cytidylyltransferase